MDTGGTTSLLKIPENVTRAYRSSPVGAWTRGGHRTPNATFKLNLSSEPEEPNGISETSPSHGISETSPSPSPDIHRKQSMLTDSAESPPRNEDMSISPKSGKLDACRRLTKKNRLSAIYFRQDTERLKTPVLPPHTDKNTYRLQLLCEDSTVITTICGVKDCLEDVSTNLVKNKSNNFPTELGIKLQYKIPGAGFLTNLHEPVGQIPYFLNCRKRRADPKFMLVVHGSKYAKMVKEDNMLIGSLLGRPMAWAQNDDENTAFRQCIARIRLLERRNVETRHKLLGHNVPVNISDGEKSDSNFEFVILQFKDTDGQKNTKKVQVSSNETADAFLQKVFKKFPESNKPGAVWSDYVLRVAGRAEYFIGQDLFYDFDYVQRAIATKTLIRVTLQLRSEVEVEKESGTYIFEREEEFLETDPVIKYDHAHLTDAMKTAGTNSDDAFISMNLFSVWNLSCPFRVKLVSVENLSASLVIPKSSRLYVEMGVYCGDQMLCPEPLVTEHIPHVPGSSVYCWNSYALTNIKLADMPRPTKLCFTLFYKKERGKKGNKIEKKPKKEEGPEKKDIEPLGWVNCLIYDYKNELRQGKVTLKMWPAEKANPIGTVVSNQTEPNAIILNIEFDEYPYTVVFPTEPLNCPEYSPISFPKQVKQALDLIINRHSLEPLTDEDKALVWRYRHYCSTIPKALPKFLMSVNKTNQIAIQESHKFLNEWAPIKPIDALELLDARYADEKIRSYAVRRLEQLSSAEIEDYLLQLVQVLKYECYHDCALSRFLLKKAITNKRIGHFLYWFLKSELSQPQVSERFGLLLEAFLRGGSEARNDIAKQERVHSVLVDIAMKIKTHKEPLEFLRSQLTKLNENWPDKCQLSLDPSFVTKSIDPQKCKIMDSKMKPLWLLFENADPLGENMYVIFKVGDDLRQDKLTLQMFHIMDKMWKRTHFNLMLNPYNVIATGADTGMIEVVTNSNTISKIQKEMSGVMGAFKDNVLTRWLEEKNAHITDPAHKKCVLETFTASCAGYCVATFVLGIGDRHNDNIMIQQNGRLFHIDFGHFLGNFKKKWGIDRERVPFVFTPDMAHVMGGKGGENYQTFIQHCIKAHQILRENYNLFINLFSMMLTSGMPELASKADIGYIVNTLRVGQEHNPTESDFQEVLEGTGSQFSTQFNFFVHNIVH